MGSTPCLVLSCLLLSVLSSTYTYVHACPHCNGFHPSEWPKRTARSGFCQAGARLAAFWGILACACPPKRGRKWVKMRLSKNDTGPLGVSLEVFLARSEADLSPYDLRRVWYASCTHNVHFKQCMLFNGVKWCCTKRRETHTPSAQS